MKTLLVLVTVLIAAGVLLYWNRRERVTLSPEQARAVQSLVKEEREEIAQELQDTVDESALSGKEVPLASLFGQTEGLSPDEKREIAAYKEDLFDKYGPAIPANTAHRISWELEGNGKMWSDYPGCWERHLQRRDGNRLFPSGRRIVTRKDLEAAIRKDQSEQAEFEGKFQEFISSAAQSLRGQVPIEKLSAALQQVQALLEEGASIGGNILNSINKLEELEITMIRMLNEAMPAGAELLQKARSLSQVKRTPYFAQLGRKDSPISPEEELAALLSEDLTTIGASGKYSRAFSPDYRPNESDVVAHIQKAVADGFSERRAARIIAAWHGTPQAD